MELGEKLKTLRTERGLTQEQLAQRLYVSRTAVSKWETGGGYPNLDSLQALASIFDVSVDDLLSGGDLIDLAREERRIEARRGSLLLYGLLDLLVALFVILPLYPAPEAGGFIRVVSLIEFGMDGMGALYLSAICAITGIGVIETAFAAAGKEGAARFVVPVGFAAQSLGVLLFVAAREPYPATLLFSLLAVKAVTAVRTISSHRVK